MSNIEWNSDLEGLCQSKAEELRLLGYDSVVAKEVWSCVSEKYVKQGIPELHQVVSDIFSLKPNQFMNYLMMSAYKGDTF